LGAFLIGLTIPGNHLVDSGFLFSRPFLYIIGDRRDQLNDRFNNNPANTFLHLTNSSAFSILAPIFGNLKGEIWHK
jgi:hypothetical protein